MTFAALTDEVLASRFVAGDTQAFEALVERYSKPLFNFVYRMLGNYDDANDVSQTVFVQAYTHLHKARLDQPIKPWLFQIARNKAIDFLRTRRAVPFADFAVTDEDASPLDFIKDQAPLPAAVYEQTELQQLLGQAINALPGKYREVVALRYASDLTFREMAETLGLPENTVKTLFQRAKSQLRDILKDYSDG